MPNTLTSAAALALIKRLHSMLTVNYVPLRDNVARLDTTNPVWVLELDTDSSAEDQCWALIDVLRVLSSGAQAAQFAQVSPRLRLVEN